jgi:hypothetical protein
MLRLFTASVTSSIAVATGKLESLVTRERGNGISAAMDGIGREALSLPRFIRGRVTVRRSAGSPVIYFCLK